MRRMLGEKERKIFDRFWSKVDKSAGPDECWPWIAHCSSDGYGHFRYDGEMRHAHTVAWILEYGKLPPGFVVRHYICNNRPCCNPSHLKDGTQLDNMKDRDLAGRTANGERSGGSKLTEREVEEIRVLWDTSKRSAAYIGRMYGVSSNQIALIGRRKNWK